MVTPAGLFWTVVPSLSMTDTPIGSVRKIV